MGASGFIGSHLVRRLEALGLDHEALGRGEETRGRDLGTVIDCAGVSFDFRERPLDTVEAHVCLVERIFRGAQFNSFTYISSTRVYRRSGSPAREDDPLALVPLDLDLYDVSKAMGEALTLSQPGGRVVRLGHVYGANVHSGNFLSAVLREVVTTGRLTLRTSLETSRDFVSVDDAVRCILDIATTGRQRIYNVSSGRPVSNAELVARLRELTDCDIEVLPGAPSLSLPPLNVDRVREEFGFRGSDLLADLPGLLDAYRKPPQIGGSYPSASLKPPA